jgi:hypothetical protein
VGVTVTVDVAGGPMGGAAQFRAELYRYLDRSGRDDVRVIGGERRLGPGWLLRREAAAGARGRRVALNNVGFVAPGGQRWTLLGNALHFLTEAEAGQLDPALRVAAARQAAVVRRAARRSDVLVAPCSAMAERVTRALPEVAGRVVVRMHPASLIPRPRQPEPAPVMVLCPVIFEAYKYMPERLAEWVAAIEGDAAGRDAVMVVTAGPDEVPGRLAASRRLRFVGRLSPADLRRYWLASQAIYFPSGLESFGYPLAEARANGIAVIARDTAQNREIAGPALCGFTIGDPGSLRDAARRALTSRLDPDPAPFDPAAYFDWMLGPGS